MKKIFIVTFFATLQIACNNPNNVDDTTKGDGTDYGKSNVPNNKHHDRDTAHMNERGYGDTPHQDLRYK